MLVIMDYSHLPKSPGCYIFKDSHGQIIYIGKARNLKKRVASYFTKKDHDPKTEALIAKIASVDFFATNNEVEALILENNLIKKHQPKYNIDLKDSKSFAYLALTDEDYPRLVIARRRGKEKIFGPFVSAVERDKILRFVRNTFRLRTCKKIPNKPCLRWHLGLCAACDNISKEEYGKLVKEAAAVLSGNTDELIAELKKEMKLASAKREYEKALKIREKINALTYLSEKQAMERNKQYDEDILSYRVTDKVYLLLFNIYKGTLVNKQEFIFNYNPDFLSEFLTLYYSENKVPKEIILPQKIEPAVHQFLENRRGSKVNIIVPKIGEKKQLLNLVEKNIELSFFSGITKSKGLGEKLSIPQPRVIECFDISHLSGTSMVGSMVQFRDGKPDKSNYRRFKIKTVHEIDDFAAIAEIVKRRYSRLKEQNAELPDLIIIDGGRGQLNSALTVMEQLGLKIPVLAIAKRFEDIYLPGLSFPLKLDKKEIALKFLQEIRDEAHRFAIKYNRMLRTKKIRE
ncbi:MAG: excinuclease ABC subunit UvrC [Candidatus Woesearchaeota archaeon]